MGKTTMKEVTYPVTVQFEDVDSYQIAHHTKLISYLERGRVSFLVHHGFDIHKKAWEIIIYSLSIQFKKPARFLDALNVSTALAIVESFQITFAGKITRGDDLIAKADTVCAFIDPKTKEIIAVPEGFAL